MHRHTGSWNKDRIIESKKARAARRGLSCLVHPAERAYGTEQRKSLYLRRIDE